MTWDLGLRGAGLLLLLSGAFGVATHLVWGRPAPRYLWSAAWAAYAVLGALVSEWWFGWATEEDLQPNVDGLSVDETLLLGGVVPFAVVALVRVVVRRRSRTASTDRGRAGGRRA